MEKTSQREKALRIIFSLCLAGVAALVGFALYQHVMTAEPERCYELTGRILNKNGVWFMQRIEIPCDH